MSLVLRIAFFVELLLILVQVSISEEVRKEGGRVEDICMLESFRPQCLKSEVILLKSATYGRMRIGRCVKADEVAAHKAMVGDDPRYLGCSADVLTILDKKCSGQTECDIRLSDIPDEKFQPCFPGLKMYLEISFECINIVDEERSCVVTASKSPTNIMVSARAKPICGTKSQPWTVEAPSGLRVAVSLIDFAVSSTGQNFGQSKQLCLNYGIIVEKAGKRNISICVGGDEQRQKELYLSTGNSVHIFVNTSFQELVTNDVRRFILKVEATGCSDVIPPEDAWLKRNTDAIVIGCYTSRQTWHLRCKEGSWVGVLGNCTHDVLQYKPTSESVHKTTLSDKGQILAIIGIGGFTLTICLIIICIGAICLRKFYATSKKEREYKTLNYKYNSVRSRGIPSRVLGDYATDEGVDFAGQQLQTTQLVFASDLNVVIDPASSDRNDTCARV